MPDRMEIEVRLVPVIGPKEVLLLELIAAHGSISAAARAVGMAYPKAWRLIARLNERFREPLTLRDGAGGRGSGTTLSPAGLRVLTLFRQMEAKIARIAEDEMTEMTTLLAGP